MFIWLNVVVGESESGGEGGPQLNNNGESGEPGSSPTILHTFCLTSDKKPVSVSTPLSVKKTDNKSSHGKLLGVK